MKQFKILLLILIPNFCFCQILNIENRNLFEKFDSNRILKFSSEFGFQYFENSKSFMNFQNSNHIQFKKKNSDLSFITDLQVLKNGNETILNFYQEPSKFVEMYFQVKLYNHVDLNF